MQVKQKNTNNGQKRRRGKRGYRTGRIGSQKADQGGRGYRKNGIQTTYRAVDD